MLGDLIISFNVLNLFLLVVLLIGIHLLWCRSGSISTANWLINSNSARISVKKKKYN